MFILASSSPRRKILLKKIINDFIIISPDIDENKYNLEPIELVKTLSKDKALYVYKDHQDDTVLACDTIVVLDNKILGKPSSKIDAIKTLKTLSNKTHLVISGYTIINKDFIITRAVISKVTMNKLTDSLINEYVNAGLSEDKAGSYGVQDKNYHLVKKVDGSIDNVIGLPIEDIIENYLPKINS